MREARPEAGEVGHGAVEVVVAEVEGVDVVAVAELAGEGAGEHVVAEADDAKLREQAQAGGGDGAPEPLAWEVDLRDAVVGAHHPSPAARRGGVRPIEFCPPGVEDVAECDERSGVGCQVLPCHGERAEDERHQSGVRHFGHRVRHFERC